MPANLIVALDFNCQKSALSLVDKLNPDECGLKVGLEMYTLFGPEFVRTLIKRQFRVFLDLKFHDIPNTVANACRAAADLGVWMTNIHALGGLDMMQAATRALDDYGQDKPLLIAVTLLTSLSQQALQSIGLTNTIDQEVALLSQLAKQAELDGVVCSPQEASLIKITCGQRFLTVTPGIRLDNGQHDDQHRILTPQKAVQSGSDYLVVGRPITQADSPEQMVQRILSELS